MHTKGYVGLPPPVRRSRRNSFLDINTSNPNVLAAEPNVITRPIDELNVIADVQNVQNVEQLKNETKTMLDVDSKNNLQKLYSRLGLRQMPRNKDDIAKAILRVPTR